MFVLQYICELPFSYESGLIPTILMNLTQKMFILSLLLPSIRSGKIDSAAIIPLIMALCVPFIFATFNSPAVHPIKHPP